MNNDDELKDCINSLSAVMGEALAMANAVRLALEEYDPKLKPLIEKYYSDLQSTALATLKEFFGKPQGKTLEDILRAFSSKTVQ